MIALVLLFLFLAVFYGAIAALFGGVAALILFAPVLPVLFTLKDFRVGLIALMLITPFQNTPFLPSFTGFNIVNYLTAATLGSLLLAHMMGRVKLAPFPRYVWWLYAIPVFLAGINGLSHLKEVAFIFDPITVAVYATPKKYLAEMVIKPSLLLLVAWMLGTAILNAKRPRLLLVPIVLGPVFPALTVLVYLPLMGYDLQFLASASPHARTVLDRIGLHANELGLLLALGLSIQLFMLPEVTGKARMALLACMAIVGAALVLTFSRGSYLAALVPMLFFLITLRKISFYLVIGIGLASVAMLFGDAIWARISTGWAAAPVAHFSAGGGMSGEELSAGRFWLWGKLFPDVWNSPIVGSGVGSTVWTDAAHSGMVRVGHPHNLYLRALLDMGMLGLLLLLLFYWKVFGYFRMLSKRDDIDPLFRAAFKGIMFGFVGFLAAGMVGANYVTDQPQTYLWLMFGAGMAFLTKSGQREARQAEAGAEAAGNSDSAPSPLLAYRRP